MVKFVQCVSRKPGMEAIRFRTYWNEYGKRLEEMVRERPNVLRYCLNTTLLVKETIAFMTDYGSSAPYDGMVELWLDDATITAANLRDPKWKPLLQEVMGLLSEFSDPQKTTAFFAAEEMVFDREPAHPRR